MQKVDVVLAEAARYDRVNREDAERPPTRKDEHTHPADYSVPMQQGRAAEAKIGPQVFDDHRLRDLQGVARLSIDRVDHCFPHDPRIPPAPGAQHQLAAAGKELHDIRELDLEGVGEQLGGLAHQLGQIQTAERELPEPGHGRLLPNTGLQRFLRALAFGNVLIDGDDAPYLPALVPEWCGGHVDAHGRAVLAKAHHFHVGESLAPQHPLAQLPVFRLLCFRE